MLVDVINESKFKNETIEVKQKSLGSEGKILDNPKPYIFLVHQKKRLLQVKVPT